MTEAEYQAALAEIETLMSAERGTPEGDRLDALVTRVMAHEQQEQRDVLSLRVCEIYHHFGNAYACDAAGRRFLLNEGSEGVAVARLEVGQEILAHVTEHNYVDRVWPTGVTK